MPRSNRAKAVRAPRLRIPAATYRLQFNRDFTFAQASEITDYLRELGITDCYASPIFRAAAQSTHGYDVCSFEEISPSLGGMEAFLKFASDLRQLGMGLLIDMVPNHMATDASNPWWWEVLQQGESSPRASWFDIKWQRPDPELRGKVLLPILEAEYRDVLLAGKLKLVNNGSGPAIAYYDRPFPISRDSVAALTSGASASAGASVTDILNELLQRQHYRLAHWREAAERINYRRFFDITDLVSLRMELPEVFQASHRLLLQLVHQGLVTGLRIDHPDGLWDPKEYCERLQMACAEATGSEGKRAHHGACYVVVEKILTDDEALPEDWPVCGTTGYDFLNRLNGLFVNHDNEAACDRIYQTVCGGAAEPFEEIAYRSKKLVLEKSFRSELNALTRRMGVILKALADARDFSPAETHDALLEIVAAFPVYRTYVTERTLQLSAPDQKHVHHAVQSARGRARTIPSALFEFLERVLLLQPPAELGGAGRRLAREFIMRFQQLTAPAMAKGLEDTAFYNYNRLVSLNEVGGDPGTFGISLEDFHRANARQAACWPHSLLATATHDTKRGEDVRARINVLSEIPEEWAKAVQQWQTVNAGFKTVLNGKPAPDSNDEYLLYQTLVGAWPFEPFDAAAFTERIKAYMAKVIKEAKAHTSWTEPNSDYEEAMQNFISRVLAPSENSAFRESFVRFQKRVAFFGAFNSLAQTLIKLTAPGVPDFYQGTELWDFSLVDPDNRRPVDFNARRRVLKELKLDAARQHSSETFAKSLLAQNDGRSKMFLIWRALECRGRKAKLFEKGSYEPLVARGGKGEHVCSFGRLLADEAVITVAPRLVVGLTNGIERAPLGEAVWEDTTVPLPRALAGRRFRNVFTGEIIAAGEVGLRVAEVLAAFPVAMLETDFNQE